MATPCTSSESRRKLALNFKPVVKTSNGTVIPSHSLRSITVTEDGKLCSTSSLKRSVKVAASLKTSKKVMLWLDNARNSFPNENIQLQKKDIGQSKDDICWNTETIMERICLWMKTQANYRGDREYLERLSRETYDFVRNPINDRKIALSKINQLEQVTKELSDSFVQEFSNSLNYIHDYQLDADDYIRIREMCGPLDYETPNDANRTLRVIQNFQGGEFQYLPPYVTSIRSKSNYDASLVCLPDGSPVYMRTGNYYEHSGLPVESLWTPRHCLMPVAPSISSPGYYEVIFLPAVVYYVMCAGCACDECSAWCMCINSMELFYKCAFP
ncbi:hypothetical protein EB796_015830 [Bugula neritina]|uniref:Uncharacterized protein n=1 Tax=Bugula neritina TaxID=10212 RepID=A0A7J7JKH6_BUGNE|nr:hypothetical protein EB796_015830 [Bugula neritina]